MITVYRIFELFNLFLMSQETIVSNFKELKLQNVSKSFIKSYIYFNVQRTTYNVQHTTYIVYRTSNSTTIVKRARTKKISWDCTTPNPR
jgi:predicted small secreted protein